ncbi:MAG: hypothetical protein DMG22_14425 [Acidobacteria bacterium]|nr:MAG: hypothetical protein DMG22_14425 [Acidobacteriota bacterium]
MKIVSRAVVAVFLSLLACAGCAGAADYYVSDRGKDSNPGTAAKPWRSLAKVDASRFAPGDRVLLEGGQTFDGNLVLDERSNANPQQPITIGSFGKGRAVIHAGLGTGILVRNIGGIVIRDLIVAGDDASKNQGFGIEVLNERGTAKLDFIRIENVDASQFRWAGIYVGGAPTIMQSFEALPGSRYGFRDVQISHSTVHHNMYGGILISGPWNRVPGGYANEDVTIRDSVVHDNFGDPHYIHHSGDGILLDDTDGGLIERCTAYHNGGADESSKGGPVGIWADAANRIKIQFCESYANHTGGKHDGGGFDLDGGVSNSIVQYNYSHDNDGPGFLVWNYSHAAHPFAHNVIRYNLSENDARKHRDVIEFGSSGQPIDHIEFYNNTVFATKRKDGAPHVVWILGEKDNTNVRLWNNLFISDGARPLIEIEKNQTGVLFQGNAYWTQGEPFVVSYQGKEYHDLARWRAQTGQETLDGKEVGVFANPDLSRMGMGETLAGLQLLSALASYHLLPASPLIDAGLDLHAKFGVDVGSHDLWETPIPQGRAFDIGAFEAPGKGLIKPRTASRNGPRGPGHAQRKQTGTTVAYDTIVDFVCREFPLRPMAKLQYSACAVSHQGVRPS